MRDLSSLLTPIRENDDTFRFQLDPVSEAETKQGADTRTRARIPSPLLVPENRSAATDRRPRATDRPGPGLARGQHPGQQFERLERLLQLGRGRRRRERARWGRAEETAAKSEGELDLVGGAGGPVAGGGAGRERG